MGLIASRCSDRTMVIRARPRPQSAVLNLDAALRVHARPHFFSWTQGVLQSLVRHEVLVCALRNGQPLAFRAEGYSTHAPNAAVFSDAFVQDASSTPNLIRTWEENGLRPLVCDAAGGGPLAAGALARELQRVGATRVIVHGTHDSAGPAGGPFIFSPGPGAPPPPPGSFPPPPLPPPPPPRAPPPLS